MAAKKRQLVITINFHFSRDKRGTSGVEELESIIRYIRSKIIPFVEIDSIEYERTDVEKSS